jgi:lysozyme
MNIEALKVDLLRDEGCKLKPYVDTVGKVTVGIGRNLTDNGITLEEARHLLENDITAVIVELDRVLPWWRAMPEPKGRALANMAFNLGLPRLLKFSKMLTALECGEWDMAADEALDSNWAKQVGERAERIAIAFRSA